MAIIPFGSQVGSTVELRAGDCQWDKLLRGVIGLRMNGGTNFELPLNAALTAIEGFLAVRQADIVFLTDGSAAVSARFKEKFSQQQEQRKISLFSVLVGLSRSSSGLEDISGAMWSVESLTEGSDVEEMLGKV